MTDGDAVERIATGISGFDDVALGGLPRGRSTLVCGTTGSGKTLFAVEFLARGIQRSCEPGVLVTFEEKADDIRRNFASLGFPIARWEREGLWSFVDASFDVFEDVEVIGAYGLDALQERISHAVRKIGATRVAIDSLGGVFTRLGDATIVRRDLARIADALDATGATSIVTAERTAEYDGVSRYGVEEYALDNVIILRNVISGERRRRTIEIVKMRGLPHRTGEWLFTIDPSDGLVVIPLAFLTTPHARASQIRVSCGNPGLDQMCGGGFYKDAIILLTGPSGAGKTLASLTFITAGFKAGERCLLFTFDETREQARRNAASWNIDIDAMEAAGLLRVICEYPEAASPEDHFIRIRRAITEFSPSRVVIDTLSALERIVTPRVLLDFMIALGAVFRRHEVTTLLTSAPEGRFTARSTPTIASEIASLADATIRIHYVERGGVVARAVTVVQTRGSSHDPAVRLAAIDAEGMHIGEPIGDAAPRPASSSSSSSPLTG